MGVAALRFAPEPSPSLGPASITGVVRLAGAGSQRNASLPEKDALPVPAADFSRLVFCLFGFPVDAITTDALVSLAASAMDQKRRCSIATANVNFLRMARQDPAFRDAVLVSDICVADGMPLVWLGWLLGLPLPERVAGSEFFARLARDGERTASVFFLGGTDDTGRKVEQKMRDEPTRLTCAGAFAPGFGTVEEMSDPAILAHINRAQPDMLVLAIGARKGLLWLARNEKSLASPVIANLGATINFLAGTVRRAPGFWQSAGLEWVWRIRQEPKLWSRYAADARALLQVVASQVLPLLVARLWPKPAQARFDAAEIIAMAYDDTCLLGFFGAFGQSNLAKVRHSLTAATQGCGHLVLDMWDVTYADAAFLGLILVAYGHQLRIGKGLVIHGPSQQLCKVFHRHGCGFLLAPDRAAGRQPAASVPTAPTLCSRY